MRCLWLASTLLAVFNIAVVTPPSAAQVQQVLPPGALLELPLVANGAYLGDVNVQATQEGDLLVDRNRLLDLLSRRLTDESLAALEARLPQVDLVPSSATSPIIEIEFDASRIEVVAILPIETLRAQEVSFGRDAILDDFAGLAPANASATLGVNFGANYVHEGGDPGFAPIAGRVYGFVNMGGVEGWSLDYEAFYQEDAETALRRGDLTLFRDFPDSATRLSLGDIIVDGTSFQGLPQLGGVSVQRVYSELTPLRSVRPTGRTSFVLENDATIDVIINGNLVRTVRFGVGAYDLRDLPFAEGANQVELIIREDTGEVRTLSFDTFSSGSLLAPGLSEFAFSAGLPSQVVSDGIEYDEDLFTATGFYRFGISDRLTFGGSAQANPRVAQVGLEMVAGFTEFLLSSDLVVSAQRESDRGPAEGSGFAAETNLRYSPEWREQFGDINFDFNAVYTSEDFATVSAFGVKNRFRWELSGRTGFLLPGGVRTSLSAAYRDGRLGFDDVTRYTVSTSRRFGQLSASASYEYSEVGDEEEHRGLLSVVFTPRGAGYLARGSYDSLDDRYRAEVSYLPGYGVGSLSGTLALETSDQGDQVFGTARYLGNRFTGVASHSAVFESIGSDLTSQVSNVSIQSGIAFVDGAVGVGPVGQSSFAVVDRGPATAGATVVVNATDEGVQARTDALGAAVVPTLRGFAPGRISAEVDSDDLALLGNDRSVQVLPGSRTGYRVTLGETVTVTIVGRAVDASGEPIDLGTGVIEPVGGGEQIGTFTNANGRFVADGVEPGVYRINFLGRGEAELTIPEDARGYYEVGVIVFTQGSI